MKIVELSASNYKKIRAITIAPDEHFVVLAGKNGSGKSTATEIITSTLEGARAIDGEPITYGEDNAWTRVDLGDLVAERKYSNGRTTLKVTGKDGVKYSNPQTVLDGLYGALGLDPTHFRDLPPAEQAKVLRELAKVDIDFEQIDEDNKADYAQRTVFNREAKAIEATIDSLLPEVSGFDATKGEIDMAKKLDQLQEEEEKVKKVEDQKRQVEFCQSEITQVEANITKTKSEIKRLQDEITILNGVRVEKIDQLVDAETILNNLKAPTPDQLQKMRDFVKNIESHNKKVQTKQRIDKLEEKLARLNEESFNCTEAIQYRSKQAADAIAAANLPVPGLAFTADGVTYNGEPFSHLSDGQKLRISMLVAMAANPKIRVIIAKTGYALDDDAMELLKSMAIEHDYQIFVERINPEPASIVIEDGAVVSE